MRRNPVLVAILAVLVIALPRLTAARSVAAQDATPSASPVGVALLEVALKDVDGNDVGAAMFSETADGVLVQVTIDGLPPGEHGIHVHETGICDPTGAEPFSSAGAHYNPTGTHHDGPPPQPAGVATPMAMEMATPGAGMGHAGDLGNITVDDSGHGELRIYSDRFHVTELFDADGSALVIHADPDDLVTDPSGNSGPRIVCGVVAAPQGTPAASPTA